jgi:SecD/SecF fusion protein
MQLKGLVRFFAIALILICIYQLSFTYFVYKHEKAMDAKATQWAKQFPTAEQKYPSDKEKQAFYTDSINDVKKAYYKNLLDSTKDTKLFFGLTTYASAKEKELMLGLDLQGGMSVTMEVNMEGLIKSLSDYSKDPSLNTALTNAVAKTNNSNELINTFFKEYLAINPTGKLAPFFSKRSEQDGKLVILPNSTNSEVESYLNTQSKLAFEGTVKKLTQRIDKFGLASPNINPIESKGIINIELAGVTDVERVRANLQSTANLQFFEVYTKENKDIVGGLIEADKLIELNIAGVKDTNGTVKLDTAKALLNKNPLLSLLHVDQSQGAASFFGTVTKRDTAKFNAYLNLPEVKSKFPSNLVFMYGLPNETADPKLKNEFPLYAIKTLDNGQAELEGDVVRKAIVGTNEMGKIDIKMDMTDNAAREWARMTTKNVGKPIAIVLDNIVYSAPNVNEPITGGNSSISGNYTINSAQDLVDILNIGALPTSAKIVQQQIIGPTLGKSTIQGGLMSFGIAFLVIFALMLLYFNTGGIVANVALVLNLLFTVGILSALGFTLTAPGIAGLVLTIGMAVDTNVIIFERIKEELTKGKSYQMAVSDGYKRSMSPVLDAHVTTLLTAIILASFGLGPVLGFATTQIIGILLSLFCGILVSRLITDIYTSKNRHFEYFTKVSKSIFKHASFKFIEFRKYAYMLSAVVLVLGIASFFNGFDQGVEFSGGRSYTIKFNKAVNTEEIRNELKTVFDGEAPIVKTVDTKNQVNITTSYLINKKGNEVDKEVLLKLYEGLKKHLPEGTSFNKFSEFTDNKKAANKDNIIQSAQTVLPSISEELKKGATNATIFALIAICLYIFIRFRDWRYSLGTIFSLLHDVFVTLIVFSFLRKVVPFPLEIDQHFIAAILTVIGFSMNDTVIVYDRIREDSKLMKGSDNATVINRAINETLSRTIMTSLTVFLVILILFIFGGEVTRGFSFAMLIGVITGTYSSIFVAAPVLVDFAKSRPLGRAESKKK